MSRVKSATTTPPPSPSGDALTRAQAAEYLGVSVSFLAVDATTKRHRVPFYKIGARAIYSRTRLSQWREKREQTPPETGSKK